MVLATLCLFLKLPAQEISPQFSQTLTGKVTAEQGKALPGATVLLQGSKTTAITAADGTFKLQTTARSGTLVVTFMGFQKATITFEPTSTSPLSIPLKPDLSALNEVQVIGYGTTSKRLNTGNVATLKSSAIENQPVTNLLSAISGRAAGVLVQTSNGLPGGGTSIQIRGKGSITAGTDPLYIVDGVPFPSSVIPANSPLGGGAINGPVSPLNSLNPADIDNISILKDADATAIYGSRGANGVILITTKKGKSGKTSVNLTLSSGIPRVTQLPILLNNQQYLQIRREAYKNDELTPSADPNSDYYAPDLMVWDTTKSTDWAKHILGKIGHFTDFQGSVTGGTASTNFAISGNFHNESTVLPGDNLYRRGGIRSVIQHTAENNKFFLQLSTNYNADNNRLTNITTTFNGDLLLPPDFPLLNPDGSYNYYIGGNPLADINERAKTGTQNLEISGLLRYTLAKGLDLKASAGYNRLNILQTMTYPTNSKYEGSANYADFGNNTNENIIVEPQLTYTRRLGQHDINLLAGGTYQHTTKQSDFTEARNFTSDLLLENISSATEFTHINSLIDYKYVSLFGRINYVYNDKYILNATIRRDGSSRFGPGREFGTFGSLGAAWLFGEEAWIKRHLGFLSYGKIRGSYGTTGNDQISDYQYLSTYGSSGYIYQGVAGIGPTKIANADFHWETTRKLEIAIELGFLKNRVLLNISRYDNRTKDQLVDYAVPYLTGFSSYQANLPAVVMNSGWEFEVNTKNITHADFTWTTTFNVTVPKNRLLSFQDLATSSYSKTLVIGQPITRIYGYSFAGLTPDGSPQYQSVSKGIVSKPSAATDQFFTIGNGYPVYFGGIGNNFNYRNWSLDVFGQFARQYTMGGLANTPGQIINNYSYLAGRWRQPGDQTNIPKASTSFAYNAAYKASSANYFNTSYFRIKNIALAYAFHPDWLKRNKLRALRIFVQGQNLLTFWNKNVPVYDPESGGRGNIPPMKTIVTGLQITL